jgi:hypothetical protein
MKKRILILLAAAAVLTTTAARAELATHIQLQQDQIISDVQSGRITQANAKTLLQRLDRIKFELKRAKSDGQINVYENQMITRMLNENAAAIQLSRQKK